MLTECLRRRSEYERNLLPCSGATSVFNRIKDEPRGAHSGIVRRVLPAYGTWETRRHSEKGVQTRVLLSLFVSFLVAEASPDSDVIRIDSCSPANSLGLGVGHGIGGAELDDIRCPAVRGDSDSSGFREGLHPPSD